MILTDFDIPFIFFFQLHQKVSVVKKKNQICHFRRQKNSSSSVLEWHKEFVGFCP